MVRRDLWYSASKRAVRQLAHAGFVVMFVLLAVGTSSQGWRGHTESVDGVETIHPAEPVATLRFSVAFDSNEGMPGPWTFQLHLHGVDVVGDSGDIGDLDSGAVVDAELHIIARQLGATGQEVSSSWELPDLEAGEHGVLLNLTCTSSQPPCLEDVEVEIRVDDGPQTAVSWSAISYAQQNPPGCKEPAASVEIGGP